MYLMSHRVTILCINSVIKTLFHTLSGQIPLCWFGQLYASSFFAWTMEGCGFIRYPILGGRIFWTYQMPPIPMWLCLDNGWNIERSWKTCQGILTIAFITDPTAHSAFWHVSLICWMRTAR